VASPVSRTGLRWRPVTPELWFTDNGRDGLGVDVPDDELNIAPKAGRHFGFPFCQQAMFRTRSSARSARVRPPSRPFRSSARTWRSSASRSTRARCCAGHAFANHHLVDEV